MGLLGNLFAAAYDPVMAQTERRLGPRRAALLERARGRVLEIGGGTGANLPFYGGAVEELVLVEPDEAMARRLEGRLRAATRAARVERSPAEALPFESGHFDCAVSTLVLCTAADPARALREVHRTLRPGGILLFIEHVRAEEAGLARWQDRLRAPWSWVARGCHCNRPTVETVRRAGFRVEELERGTLPGAPAFLRPMVIGVARRIA